jgi:ring-1,2-phenylacetyl-CoA epoxidase subunit PaaD
VVRTEARSLESRLREALAAIPDPEIPACSIVDLGMVERVEATAQRVEVDLLPTFIGCPAKDIIGEEVERAARGVVGEREVRIRFVYDPPWTTDRITDRGKEALRSFGISPHWERGGKPVALPLLTRAGVACPYCGSTETVTESAFGPTPCRTVHFCRRCRNPFEGFKTKDLPSRPEDPFGDSLERL